MKIALTKRIGTFSFLVCFSIFALAQHERIPDFETIWNNRQQLEEKLHTIHDTIVQYQHIESDHILENAYKGLSMAKVAELEQLTASFELTIGAIYSTFDFQDSAKHYLLPVLEKFQQLQYKPEIARANKELSWLYTFIPDFDAALEYAYTALGLYKELDNLEELAIMKSSIAFLLERMGRFEQAFPLYMEANQELQSFNNPKELGITFLGLANYYRNKQDTLKALPAFNDYIHNIHAFGEETALCMAYQRRGKYFREIGEANRAEQDFQKALTYVHGRYATLLRVILENELGRLYVEMGKYEEGTRLLESAIDKVPALQAEEGGILDVDFEEMYKTMSQAYAGMGAYDQAYLYQSKLMAIEDSLFTVVANRNMIEMQTKYETEKKQALLDQKERQLYLTIAFLMLILVMAGALWRAYYGKKQQNLLLEQRNEEKAFLIKEIHHRVKNNLQVLSSLLFLQADYIADPHAMDAVMEGHNRVQSMGLIHQKLYMGDALASVDIGAFVQDLGENLLMTFGMEDRVTVSVEHAVPPLDVDTAIPLGLIINELLTNSLKYAFPEDKEGRIDVKLWINALEELCLQVKDNGLGKLTNVSPEQSTSFGMDLIKMLSQKLEGEIQIDQEAGYSTTIQCKKYK